MLRRTYDWTMALSGKRYAEAALAGVAFAESSFFPIPPDLLLIPMVLAERAKAWRFAAVATAASVIGGLFGYLIGAVLFEQVARPILDFYGYGAKFDAIAGLYNQWGVWIVLTAGLTPFPYKVITIASGATGLNLAVFLLASLVARSARFFIVAALLYWVGPPIRAFIEKRLGLVFTALMVLLIGGFLVARYVF
jgi:membrane protein YqaA with SNARE-associated domain